MTSKSDKVPGLNICIFCAANQPNERLVAPAVEFGRLMAQNGHSLVYGGSNVGLMKQVAVAVKQADGRVIGVPLETLKEGVNRDCDELIDVATISERKIIMRSRSDALVIMVGGLGTSDEALDAIEHRRHGLNNMPIVVLDTDGFYKNLRLHLEKIESEGLLAPHTVDDLVYFASTPQEALNYIEDNAKPDSAAQA